MSFRIISSCCLRQLSRTASKRTLVPYNTRLISSIPVSRAFVDVSLPRTVGANLQPCRFKSKKSKKQQKEVEEDDDDEADDEEGGDDDGALPGEKEKTLKMGQARTDKVLKLALNSTKVVEDAFLEGRLFKNEAKLLKKASPIQEGDILDVEVGPDPKNPDFIKVHRVEIKEMKEGTHMHVKVLVSKNLTIKRHSS